MPPRSAHSSSLRRATRLIGRDAERRELDSLLEALRRGVSRCLVIRGEAGVGKTVLLDHLAGGAGTPIVFDGLHSDYSPAIKNVPAFIAGLYPDHAYTQISSSGDVYVFRRAR
jgi:AAA ATPase domain